jgi:hypothetical protein
MVLAFESNSNDSLGTSVSFPLTLDKFVQGEFMKIFKTSIVV